MGFLETLSKFSIGLTKTRNSIVSKIQQLASTKSTIDDALLDQIEEILIASDIGVDTTAMILARLKQRVKEEKYQSTDALLSQLKEVIINMLAVENEKSTFSEPLIVSTKPYVIMIVGVNGVGKTTTVGKMAFCYRQAGHKVVIAAADTFRAAANEQLEIWAKRAGVDIIQQSHGADPAAVAFDAINSAVSKKSDIVIIDTAGRLHTKINLMEELKKIKRVIAKRLPGAPHETFLVLDATTGQNGLQQVKQFSIAVDITGLVLTKLDGTAKGGIVLSICHELKTPVKFIGVGEQIDDLQVFDHKAFAEALFEGNEITVT
jgi:fused signal recognition particle receptor